MVVTQRRDATPAVRAWLNDQLPYSEFSVSMLEQAGMVLEVHDASEALVGVAVGMESQRTLSGAPVLLAVTTSTVDDAVVDLVADELAAVLGPLVRGARSLEVLGPGGAPTSLARRIAGRIGGTAAAVMEQRLFAVEQEEVVVPWAVPGWVRRAVPSDHDTLARWMDGFSAEALGAPPRGPAAWLEQVSAVGGDMRVWELDGVLRAMAYGRRTTPVSARIGPVYTPRGQRRHGYAAALTAHLSRELLRRHERVVLLTDTTNPTSNSLYLRIGYRDVARHASWVVQTS